MASPFDPHFNKRFTDFFCVVDYDDGYCHDYANQYHYSDVSLLNYFSLQTPVERHCCPSIRLAFVARRAIAHLSQPVRWNPRICDGQKNFGHGCSRYPIRIRCVDALTVVCDVSYGNYVIGPIRVTIHFHCRTVDDPCVDV